MVCITIYLFIVPLNKRVKLFKWRTFILNRRMSYKININKFTPRIKNISGKGIIPSTPRETSDLFEALGSIRCLSSNLKAIVEQQMKGYSIEIEFRIGVPFDILAKNAFDILATVRNYGTEIDFSIKKIQQKLEQKGVDVPSFTNYLNSVNNIV